MQERLASTCLVLANKVQRVAGCFTSITPFIGARLSVSIFPRPDPKSALAVPGLICNRDFPAHCFCPSQSGQWPSFSIILSTNYSTQHFVQAMYQRYRLSLSGSMLQRTGPFRFNALLMAGHCSATMMVVYCGYLPFKRLYIPIDSVIRSSRLTVSLASLYSYSA